MERKFKCGDLVKLQSDSDNQIAMTVKGYVSSEYSEAVMFGALSKIDESSVICTWRNKNSEPCEKNYPEDCLVKIC